MNWQTISMLALTFSTLLGSAEASGASARFAVLPGSVAESLRAQGMQVDTKQVSLPAIVTASEAVPRLQVVGTTKLAQTEAAVRLACESTAVCLPFYAIVRCQDSDECDRILQNIQPASSAKKPMSGKLAAKKPTPPCIRSGEQATLILETEGMRITMPVISMQSGRVGEIIRVKSTDRKNLYRAEVVQAGLLKASMGTN